MPLVAVGARGGGLDAQALGGEHVLEIAQESAPVVGVDGELHREGAGGIARPLDLEDPIGLARAHARETRTVTRVHRDAAPEGDVAGDRLRGQGRAAARQRDRQVAHALDFDGRGAPARTGRPCRPRRGDGDRGGEARRRLQQLRQGDLTLAEQLVQVLGVACLELARERGELLGTHSDARELALG